MHIIFNTDSHFSIHHLQMSAMLYKSYTIPYENRARLKNYGLCTNPVVLKVPYTKLTMMESNFTSDDSFSQFFMLTLTSTVWYICCPLGDSIKFALNIYKK
jgi:hypothetical protein